MIILLILHLGHIIGQLQVIMQIIPSRQTPSVVEKNPYVTYVQQFDVVPQFNPATQLVTQSPESASSLYALKRAQ